MQLRPKRERKRKKRALMMRARCLVADLDDAEVARVAGGTGKQEIKLLTDVRIVWWFTYHKKREITLANIVVKMKVRVLW